MFSRARLKCVAGRNLESVDVQDKKHGNKNTVQKGLDDIRKELECEGYHCSDIWGSHSGNDEEPSLPGCYAMSAGK